MEINKNQSLPSYTGKIGNAKPQGEAVNPDLEPKDSIAIYNEKKDEGFMNKLKTFTKGMLNREGRVYLTTTGILGIGLGVAGAAVFGPIMAIAGGAVGLTAGLVAGGIMNTPISFFKSKKDDPHKDIPPGSDVKVDSVKGESALLSPEIQKRVDLSTDSHVTEGNKMTLLKDGAMSFPERYKLMESAKTSINVQTLIFQDDETGWKTAELLAKKAKEGVKCRVIYDWLSSPPKSKIFDYMKENGVDVVAFNPPLDYKWHEENTKEIKEFMKEGWQEFKKHLGDRDFKEFASWAKERQLKKLKFWWGNAKEFVHRVKEYPPVLVHRLNNRWHQKILTVDNKAAIVGGMNIASDYAYGGTNQLDMSQGPHSQSCKWMRDTDVKVEGPAVDEVIETFAKNWALGTSKDSKEILTENPPAEKAGSTETRFISHWPLEKKDKNIENWYYEMLDNARETAYITNPYFVPNDDFVKHLCDAAKRGIDVRVITNSQDTNDLQILSQASRDRFAELLEGGVRLYELKPHESGVLRSLHAKTAVFDGEVSTVGSNNLDPRSFNLNSEDTLTIHDREFGKEMNEMFKDDCTEITKEITKEDLKDETPGDRMEQWFYGKVLDFLL